MTKGSWGAFDSAGTTDQLHAARTISLRRRTYQSAARRVLRAEPMDGVYCVTRRGLVDALRAGLPGDAVEYGWRCTSVVLDPPPASHPRGIERRVRSVGFAGGPSLSGADADLFVGAEGSRSALGAALNPGLARTRSRVFEIVMSTRLRRPALRVRPPGLRHCAARRRAGAGSERPAGRRPVDAYNHRWAVQPPGVIPLTAADPDFPVCEEIIAAVQRHLSAGYVPNGPAEGLPELWELRGHR